MFRLLLLCYCIFSSLSAIAQNCSSCEIAVPDNLPLDTVFLSTAAAGQVGQVYNQDLSFRLPLTTTPVSDESTPAGLTINQFEITGVANLPPGLEWNASQTLFDPAENNDGCAKICGTPLVAGEYVIQVSLVATVLIVEAVTILEVPIRIDPRQSTTVGFSLRNGTGCGTTRVSFRNNVPSGGMTGFDYQWDFGNGQMTNRENPLDVQYDTAGTYTVKYQAVVDTVGHFLTNVRVDAADCDDFLSRPDLQVKIFDTLGVELFASQVIENAVIPVDIPLNFRLKDPRHRMILLDVDSGLGGADDICGEFALRPLPTGTYEGTAPASSITYQLLNPTDTIRSQDTVIVYPIPSAPQISVVDTSSFCQGDSAVLAASYDTGVQWYVDTTILVNEDRPSLTVRSTGSYYATYTSENGCVSRSDTVDVSVNERPAIVEFSVENNLLMLDDTSNLSDEISWEWYMDDMEIIDAETNARTYCISESGRYELQVTNASGCTSSFGREVVYDDNFPNCISSTDTPEEAMAQIQYSPNPVRDALYVSLQLPQTGNVQLSILDALGRKWYSASHFNNRGMLTTTLPTANLNAGWYVLQLQTKSATQSWTFIKQ